MSIPEAIGPYQVLGLLGQGGMAEGFRGRASSGPLAGRELAVKRHCEIEPMTHFPAIKKRFQSAGEFAKALLPLCDERLGTPLAILAIACGLFGPDE